MDIPYEKLPHLSMGIQGTKIDIPNLCLYRGNINEWFYRSIDRDVRFIDLVNEWIEDAVTGELIKADGFETIRRNEKPVFFVVANYDYLERVIESNSSDRVCRFLSSHRVSENLFRLDNREYEVEENVGYPCILICDRSSVEEEFISNIVKTVGDLSHLKSIHLMQHAAASYRNKIYMKESVKYNGELLVVVGIKRPQQVIGSSSEYEFLALMIAFDMKSNPIINQCPCLIGALISDCSVEASRRISGINSELKSVTIIGCGAVGSNVSMMLAKMGIVEQHLIDNDILLPHNLVRHYANNGHTIGMQKVLYQKMTIESIYNTGKIQVDYKNVIDINPEDISADAIIDCSASEIVFDWLCNQPHFTKKIMRTELAYNGKMGITLVESTLRKNSIGDLRTYLWYRAVENDLISDWLRAENENEDVLLSQLHIGMGCSSDTMILDNATIWNHTSILPNILLQNYSCETGKVVINYFDKEDITQNKIFSFDVESFVELSGPNDFKIRVYEPILKKVTSFLADKEENAGIWIGSVNHKTNTIYIVDTFMPQDNKRSNSEVIRGSAGVAEFVINVEQRCNSYVGYLGEWHTHPRASSCMSNIDKNTFESMSKIKGAYKILLMTIFGKTDIQNYIYL